MNSEHNLTRLQVFYLEGRANYRLLFGQPALTKRVSRSQSFAFFEPGRMIGYLRWRANEFGTQSWRCFVLRTMKEGEHGVKIPGILPGAEPLLTTRGKTYSKRFLKKFDALRRVNQPLENLSPAYWRHLHVRIHLNIASHDPSEAQWRDFSFKSGAF